MHDSFSHDYKLRREEWKVSRLRDLDSPEFLKLGKRIKLSLVLIKLYSLMK